MDREILYRGKRKDNGEWIDGFITGLCGYSTDKQTGKVTHIDSYYMRNHCIDAKTVGEYTGLTDKNGKKIFEGDIVKCRDINNDIEFTSIVEFGNPNHTYNWGWQFRIIGGDKNANPDILLWVDMEKTGAICEVIGNIHDNKGLLEVSE